MTKRTNFVFISISCNVTTAGLTSVSASCPNKPQRPVTADILIADINHENIGNYDCVLITSGAQHHILGNSNTVFNLIEMAHEEGLIVSSLCSGNYVLGKADAVVNGTKVASFSYCNAEIRSAGGIPTYARVVSDNNIVTGGSGGGQSMGYSYAPMEQICKEIVKSLLGYSFVVRTTMTQETDETGTNFTLSVETTNLTGLYSGLNASLSGINKVTAKVYLRNSTILVESITMTDLDNDDIYTGYFTGNSSLDYCINVEVTDNADSLEIVRDAFRNPDGNSTDGFSIAIFVSTATVIFLRKKMRK